MLLTMTLKRNYTGKKNRLNILSGLPVKKKKDIYILSGVNDETVCPQNESYHT